MSGKSALTRKQLDVIDDLFKGELEENEILQNHKINRAVFNRWLNDENFTNEFHHRIEWLNLQSQALIARYASLAAAKLVALTDSQKEETRRKVCLDIISLPRLTAQKQPDTHTNADPQAAESLHPKTASRLLEALAGDKNAQQNDGNSA